MKTLEWLPFPRGEGFNRLIRVGLNVICRDDKAEAAFSFLKNGKSGDSVWYQHSPDWLILRLPARVTNQQLNFALPPAELLGLGKLFFYLKIGKRFPETELYATVWQNGGMLGQKALPLAEEPEVFSFHGPLAKLQLRLQSAQEQALIRIRFTHDHGGISVQPQIASHRYRASGPVAVPARRELATTIIDRRPVCLAEMRQHNQRLLENGAGLQRTSALRVK